MDLKELILQSWTSLQRNRLRSVLTMMGIVWGSDHSRPAARLRRERDQGHRECVHGNRQ